MQGRWPVTTGPQDLAAAGRDRLRASHADREQAVETLKDAFVYGRLTRDELDVRAGQALIAQTYADLAALTADIPPSPVPGSHPARPARAGGRHRGAAALPGRRDDQDHADRWAHADARAWRPGAAVTWQA
jgi:hypothetical protein